MAKHVLRALALLAFVSVTAAQASADAMADQKKVYQILGKKIPQPAAMCHLLTKSEAAHYLGKPVGDGESAGVDSGCAYNAMDGSNDGVLVTRQSRGAWFPQSNSPQYHTISGVGEKAFTDLEEGVGYEAEALTSKGVTNVQISGKAPAANALALLRLAMNR